MSSVRAIAGRHATTAFLLALTLVYASEISSVRSLFDEGFVSTRFLPRLLAGISLAAILVIAWRDERTAATNNAAKGSGSARPGRPYLLFVVILGYIALFQPLGFVSSTIALSLSCLWLFDFAADRDSVFVRFFLNLLAAIVITALAYLLFAVAFGARLPLFPELG